MSLVSAFVTSAHAQASSIIGTEDVVIGAATIPCTLAETDDSNDYSEGGFERSKTLRAVCLTSALPTTSIIKKVATARGETFRVDSLSKGATFTTITLKKKKKA